jgi:hypothetical protein
MPRLVLVSAPEGLREDHAPDVVAVAGRGVRIRLSLTGTWSSTAAMAAAEVSSTRVI